MMLGSASASTSWNSFICKFHGLDVTLMKMESESEQKEFRHCKKMACPGNPKQLMSVLRLFSYLSSHIVNYAKLTKPLWDLQRAEKWNWTEECEKAFKKIKEVIVHASTIGFLDLHKELYLYTDASQDAIAGILTSSKWQTCDD